MSGRFWRLTHVWLAVVWTALAVPTFLWWRDSILWIGFMSIYAIVATHVSAYQAARSEEASTPEEGGD